MFEIRWDDLSHEAVQELLKRHLVGMRQNSPPGEGLALELSGLRTSNITVWSAWDGSTVAGIAALRVHDNGTGELKWMRTHTAHLRKGVARALLDHIISESRQRPLRRLRLERGYGSASEPAIALYRKYGFVHSDTFAAYRPSTFSQSCV